MAGEDNRRASTKPPVTTLPAAGDDTSKNRYRAGPSGGKVPLRLPRPTLQA